MATLAQLSAAVRAPATQLPSSTTATANSDDADAASSADWARVIAALRTLGADAQEQLATAESALAALDADAANISSDATTEITQRVWAASENVDALRVDLETAARHFRDVAACAAPACQRLAALEARAAYLRAALDAERLSARAETLAKQATGVDALEAFQELSVFVSALPAEFAHVREVADRRLRALSSDLKTFAVEKLQRALLAAAWPPEGVTADDGTGRIRLESDEAAVGRAFGYLLTLQLSQERAAAGPSASATRSAADLWAMETLLELVIVRFRFHFERADSATSRLAKPEWMLSHILTQVRTLAPFLAEVVSPELEKQSDTLQCSDAQVLLLRGLIHAAQRKLRKDIPRLISVSGRQC